MDFKKRRFQLLSKAAKAKSNTNTPDHQDDRHRLESDSARCRITMAAKPDHQRRMAEDHQPQTPERDKMRPVLEETSQNWSARP